MRKKTQEQRNKEYIKIRYSYKYDTEAKIAKEYHVSYSEISKALHNPKFNNIKETRLNRIKAPVMTNKTLTTKDLNNHKSKEKPTNNSSNNVAKNNNYIIPKSDSKLPKSNLIKNKSFNQINKVSSENNSKVSQSTSNSVNNIINNKVMSKSKPNSSATNSQSTQNKLTKKSRPSSKAKKVPSKSELEIAKKYQNSSAPSISKSVNHSKKNQFMPYMSKKDRQEEQDLEATINPHEIDYFSLRQLMTLYLDNAHQQFITNHWDCLYKRLSQHYTQRILIRAKALNILFKNKMKAKEHAEKKTKKFFNKLFNR